MLLVDTSHTSVESVVKDNPVTSCRGCQQVPVQFPCSCSDTTTTKRNIITTRIGCNLAYITHIICKYNSRSCAKQCQVRAATARIVIRCWCRCNGEHSTSLPIS